MKFIKHCALASLLILPSYAQTETPTAPSIPAGLEAPGNVAKAPENAQVTKSGLASIVLKKGTGTVHPSATDKVTVHYTGWRSETGEMFDSSLKRGRAATFPLDGVIAGWTEGLQLMVEGEKRRFWIPGNLAYDGSPSRPQGTLCFDVELIAIDKPIAAPADVAAAPANAEKTESGLASVVLQKGTGARKPAETDLVLVHYTGWTKDGKMFDSSVKRGEPTAFALNQVIQGWTEGVQLMVEGEKRRFWIPGKMAYGDEPVRPGMPYGQLTFDVELLKVISPQEKPDQAPTDALKMENGVKYKFLKKGEGSETLTKDHLTKLHFTGWQADGKLLSSTYNMPRRNALETGQPIEMRVGSAVPFLRTALGYLKQGDVVSLWVPNVVLVGKNPQEGAPKEDFYYELEVVEATMGEKTPDAPADVAKAPQNARKLESGVAYVTLTSAPEGAEKITESSLAHVEFTAWTTDGEEFDSSAGSHEALVMHVASLPEGLQELLLQMSQGETCRAWIPNELVLGKEPQGDVPTEDFCFELKVVKVEKAPAAPASPEIQPKDGESE